MANLLTGIRLLLIVPVALALALPGFLPDGLLVLLLLLAIVTDYADGRVARRRGTASAAGQLFDHTTDFLFVTSGCAGLAHAGSITWWLPPLIVLAFSQYVLDSHFLYRQKQLRMSFIGRWNGVLYFVPLCTAAAARLQIFEPLVPLLVTGTAASAYLLLVSTVVSIVDRALAPLRHRP